MTNISKCLVVLATVASLAFLGVASVSSVGGPNYEAQFDDPTLESIAFTVKVDEETGKRTYSAQTRRKRREPNADPKKPPGKFADKNIATDSKVLPHVLIEARKFVQKEQKAREQALDDVINGRKADAQKGLSALVPMQKKIDDAKRMIKVDIAAMETRLKGLNQKFKAVYASLVALNTKAVTSTFEASKLRVIAKRRRQEIERLRSQVEELKADQFRLIKQKQKLEVILVRLQGINKRLARRQAALLKQGAQPGNSKTPAKSN
jgi:hypothetical protein